MNQYRIVVFFVMFLMHDFFVIAQEHILDPGFESMAIDSILNTYFYENWLSLTSYEKQTKSGAPKYSLYLNTIKSRDSMVDAYYEPAKGDSYMTCHHAYLRNLYQGKLMQPLKKGRVYKVSFKYKIIAHRFSSSQVYDAVVDNIGCFFTTTDWSDSTKIKVLKNPKLKLEHHVALDTFDFNKNMKWIQFDDYFVADKNYQYLIVGNVRKIIRQSEIGHYPIKGITYRIDEIHVTPVESITESIIAKTRKPKKRRTQSLTSGSVIDSIPLKIQKIHKLLGQSKTRQSLSDSVAQYYKYISEAELAIIEGDFTKGLSAYCDAFDYKLPFWRDYLNASYLISDYQVLDSLLLQRFLYAANKLYYVPKIHKKILDRLLGQDSLFHQSYVYHFKNDPKLDTVPYNTKIDSSLIAIVDSLEAIDQTNLRQDRMNLGQRDAITYAGLLQLYKKHPLISEETIGKNGMLKLELIWIHVCRYPHTDWISLLKEEVLKGNFDNRVFANLVDYHMQYNISIKKEHQVFMMEMAYPVYTKYAIPQYKKETLATANHWRKQLFLEPIEQQQIKQLYNFRKGYDPFEFYTFFSILPSYIYEPDSEMWLKQEANFIEELDQVHEHFSVYDIKDNNYDINIESGR